MIFNYNDGGRAAAGITGGVNDCVSRALAIVTERDYAEVTAELSPLMTRNGIDVYSAPFLNYMRAHGFNWISEPFRVQVNQLPRTGRLVAFTPNHLTAVVDGVVNDVFDTGLEYIRGYWVRFNSFNVYQGKKKLNMYPLNAAQAETMRALFFRNYGGADILIKPAYNG